MGYARNIGLKLSELLQGDAGGLGTCVEARLRDQAERSKSGTDVEGLVSPPRISENVMKRQQRRDGGRIACLKGRSARFVAMGTLAIAAVGQVPVAWAAAHTAQDQAQVSTAVFDIPAGTLVDALSRWKQATGVSLEISLSPETVAGFRSKAVRGTLTNAAALKEILDGTGLGFHFEHGGTRVQILIVNSEQVSVSTSTNSVALSGFTESLTDTAQTVAVVPQYILQEQATTTLRDGLRNVPGISLAAGEGGSQGDSLTIRGFNARNDIYMDGIRDFGSYYRDAFDYESIDVLEGPASVEFGRGSTGGVVNQESKQAVSNQFVRTNLQFGTNALRRGTLDINLPLTEYVPHAAWRINAVGIESGVASRDVSELRRVGVASSLVFGLGQPTRLTVNYLHEFEDTTPDYGLPYFANGVAPVRRANYYGFAGGNFLRTQPDVATGIFEHDFGTHLTLRSTLRWGYYPRNVVITEPQINTTGTVTGAGLIAGTGGTTGVTALYNSYSVTCNPNAAAVASQCYPVTTPLSAISVLRNQIASNSVEDDLWNRTEAIGHVRVGSIDNDYTVAVEGGRERSSPLRSKYVFAPGLQYTSALNPTYNDAFTPTAVAYTGFTHVTSESYAVNFLDTLKLKPWLLLTGGVRFDYFNTRAQAGAITPTSTAGLASPNVAAGLTSAAATDLSRLDKQPTYRAAVIVKPTPNGSVYFDYGTSFNPSAESLSLAANTATAPPEENTTYEVGAKWEFLRSRLNVNSSLFRTEKLNARETDPTNTLNSLLVGNQLVRGVQVGAVGHLPQHLDLIVGYAYLDGRVENSILNASPFAAINNSFYAAWQAQLKTNPNAKVDARYNTAPYYLSPNNYPFANVPKNSGNFWVTHALKYRFTGGFGGNYLAARRASSTSVIGVYNTGAAQSVGAVPLAFKAIPGYTVINAMIRRPLTERIDLQVNFNNLTNKFYIDTPHPQHLIPGEGFNTQFSLVGRF